MLLTPSTLPARTSLSDSSASEKHCVFRCGASWYSVPAVAVRQIVVTPDVVQVPGCHRALVGLGRVRGEFIPILALGSLLEHDGHAEMLDGDCVLVLEGKCLWSLLISESIALESMETIVSQEARTDGAHNGVIGTAMFQERIVRVLNPSGLLAAAQATLDEFWDRSTERLASTHTSNEMGLL
jgi:chemotaxis signal transduction protein